MKQEQLTGCSKQHRTPLHEQLKLHMLNALKFHTIKCMPAYEEGMANSVCPVQGTATRAKT